MPSASSGVGSSDDDECRDKLGKFLPPWLPASRWVCCVLLILLLVNLGR